MNEFMLDTDIFQSDKFSEAFELLHNLSNDPGEKNLALDKVSLMLAEIDDQAERDIYLDHICKEFKIKKKIIQGKLKTHLAKRKPIKTINGGLIDSEIPEDVDKEEALKNGFFVSNNAYYFLTKDGVYKASNFSVIPVLHIYSKSDNKRIIDVINEYGERKTLDLPSKNLVSTDLFQQSVFNEGNFLFFGTRIHHYRILSNISKEFPVANELRTLGWQREGFYAFSNGIYSDSWLPVNDIGVTTHNEIKYFSPAFSKIYADVREDDDEFENDRFFVYQKANTTFSDWSKLMLQVYGENAIHAVAFAIAAAFRDTIYNNYKIFPHLFLFGEKQSGKSQLAWSLSNLYFKELPAFNLNSGTQVGFFRRLSRVKNSVCWFDEYTNDIDERRFQALKSAYDGMGHEKGKMSKDSRTEITKVNSATVISGQYLPTRDDNSLLTRSILLLFEKKNYSQNQILQYDKLKQLESTGLSSLVTDVVKYRALIEKHYNKYFCEVFDMCKNKLNDGAIPYDERLVRNYTTILAALKIFQDNNIFDLGFSFQEAFEHSIVKITDQSAQITSSEAVSTFWMMIQFMFEVRPNPMITTGEDFKIQMVNRSLKIKNKKEQWETIDFYREPKKLIFFRFTKIHPLYMEAHRKQYGKNGVDMVSIIHYIKHHKAFIGYMDSTRFDNSNTSAYVFDYAKLGLSLEVEEATGLF